MLTTLVWADNSGSFFVSIEAFAEYLVAQGHGQDETSMFGNKLWGAQYSKENHGE